MSAKDSRALQQTRVWLDEIESLARSADQVDRMGLILIFAGGAVAGAIVSLVTLLGLTPGITPAWVHFIVVTFIFGLVAILRRPKVSNPTRFVTLLIASIGMLGAAWTNGLNPLANFAVLTGVVHLLLRPRAALIFCLGLLAVVIALIVHRHLRSDPALLMRLIIGNVLTVMLWQLTSRFWRGWVLRVRDLGQQMSAAVAALENEKTLATRAARLASSTDAASGLPNRRGFAEVLARRLTPAADQAPRPGACHRHPLRCLG